MYAFKKMLGLHLLFSSYLFTMTASYNVIKLVYLFIKPIGHIQLNNKK